MAEQPKGTPAERLRKVTDRKIRKSRAYNYEPTMVTVSIADLEQVLGDYKEMVAHLWNAGGSDE